MESNAMLAGTFAIANGLVIGLNSGLGFGEAAQFYRQLSSDAKQELYALEFDSGPDQIKRSRDIYQQLERKRAYDLPLGAGISK